MKKIFVPLFILCLLMCLSLTVGAASISPGLAVMYGKMKMIKTGVGINSVAFCAEDFENFVGTDVSSVKILSVPDSSQGKLMLGEGEVSSGQEISAVQLAALRFVPAGEKVSASFEFAPDGGEESRLCAVTMLASLDFAPKAADISASAVENVSYSGTLTGTDPEGDTISFYAIKSPRHGTLLLDALTGAYVYTPNENYHGSDRFTYSVKDEYGNVSDAAEVKITVGKNKNGIVYVDMEKNPSYTAAVAVGEKGIIVGEVIGGQRYFYPKKPFHAVNFLLRQ